MERLRLLACALLVSAIVVPCANAQVTAQGGAASLPTQGGVASLPTQGTQRTSSPNTVGAGSSISKGSYGPGSYGPGSYGPGNYGPGNDGGAYVGGPGR
jgi:hypothetical protein